MIDRIFIYESFGMNPYENLAAEKYLLDTVQPGQCILYLWQNQNTVVIGRNQNPWAECRTALLEAEGGYLARRLSGGGAVFHDAGNLNFTFLVSAGDYCLDRQLEVIRQACLLAGIPTETSGRNDLLADGRKFSGNAFYHTGSQAYHHGTLLISADMDKLSRYLSPPPAKLEAKGIRSVRSRVVNLEALSPGLTCEQMRTHMKAAFASIYGLRPQVIVPSGPMASAVSLLAEEYGSWDYLYGRPLPFTFQCADKFSWGYVQLQMAVKNGYVTDVKVYSDAMDWRFSEQTEAALRGSRFLLAELREKLRAGVHSQEAAEDLCQLLARQDL